MTDLLRKIQSKEAHVVVMGIGYVGLPVVAEFARAGFRTTGLDPDPLKVNEVLAGRSYIADVPTEDIAPHVKSGRLDASTDASVLSAADAVAVCVPTPLNKTKDPEMRFIVKATDQIAEHQHPGMLVVLESTTYPGTTSEVLVPKLTSNDSELGKDIFVAFSPERVDPGNPNYGTKNTPKVIGGATPACLEMAHALYSQIIDTLVPVSSTETAEMVKLLENTFRAVNIGLVNEMAMISRKLGVDPFEVIRAASTKPYGFMPFYPGPGLGGHCIPIDPLYLSWKLRTMKFQARFIELADTINTSMPAYVASRIGDALNDQGKSVRGSKILVYGAAYKPNIDDVRESPAFDVILELRARGAVLSYEDPFAPELDDHGITMRSITPGESYEPYDLVVILTDHAALDRPRLLQQAKLIVDTRDALRDVPGDRSKVYGL